MDYQGRSRPAGGINLASGNYIAEAWTGDSVSASFTERFFKGAQDFTVSAGTTSRVTVTCGIANVVTTVEYSESIDKVLSDYTMTVGHSCGSLEYVGRDESKGYFMMPSTDTDLTWTLKGTLADGKEFTKSGTLKAVQPAHLYALSVKYVPGEAVQEGGAFITVEVDESAVEISDQVVITAAPVIKGLNFDLSQTITAEPGAMGRKTLLIGANGELTSLVLKSSDFPELLELSGDDFDAVRISEDLRNSIAAHGLLFYFESDPETDQSQVKVVFEDEYTVHLASGEHSVTFTATDSNGKSTTAVMNMALTDAAVVTEPVNEADVYTSTAALTGSLLKSGASEYGIRYRIAGTQDWTSVPANLSRSGEAFSVTLTGLTPATTYEYASYADTETGTIRTFTTEAAAQLPNAGFEIWNKVSIGGKNILVPGNDLSFWDTGNHGSATMNKEITNQGTEYKNSGDYSAKLKSQFVGIGSIGKFAAGNVFAGRYLGTDGTDGILGWGRIFTSRPTAVKVWVRYEPGTAVTNKGAGSYLPAGATDQGIIYMALTDATTVKYDGSKTVDSSLTGTEYACIVKTKTSELFDPEGDNVIAYGVEVLDATTEPGMIQITIPLDYRRTDIKPSNILFVASASRYGDYFQGGEGSTLYIDDIELVY